MKKYFLGLVLCLGLLTAQAQVKTPAPSPLCKIEQSVGLTDISLEYSRPGVKNRTIFGDLVPYGKKWRTGANRATKISFSTDVNIGGVDVEKGQYAIYTMPSANSWTVFLYTDASGGGVPKEWDDSKVAAKFDAKTTKTSSKVESFTIGLNEISNSGASLDFSWENTMVSVPVEVGSDEMVMASIDKTMAGPSAGDYYAAARYYRESGKDLNKAGEWMEKAMAAPGNSEKFWMVRQQSLLLADMGDVKGAIAAAKKSLELAKAAGNADYIKMNEESIAEWMKK